MSLPRAWRARRPPSTLIPRRGSPRAAARWSRPVERQTLLEAYRALLMAIIVGIQRRVRRPGSALASGKPHCCNCQCPQAPGGARRPGSALAAGKAAKAAKWKVQSEQLRAAMRCARGAGQGKGGADAGPSAPYQPPVDIDDRLLASTCAAYQPPVDINDRFSTEAVQPLQPLLVHNAASVGTQQRQCSPYSPFWFFIALITRPHLHTIPAAGGY
eukprot:1161512-Pelagomonas_calceolata.AAC.3